MPYDDLGEEDQGHLCMVRSQSWRITLQTATSE